MTQHTHTYLPQIKTQQTSIAHHVLTQDLYRSRGLACLSSQEMPLLLSSKEGKGVVVRAGKRGHHILLLDEPAAKRLLGHELYLLVAAVKVELAGLLVKTEACQLPRPNAALDHFLRVPVSHTRPHTIVPLGAALGLVSKGAGKCLAQLDQGCNVGPRQRQLAPAPGPRHTSTPRDDTGRRSAETPTAKEASFAGAIRAYSRAALGLARCHVHKHTQLTSQGCAQQMRVMQTQLCLRTADASHANTHLASRQRPLPPPHAQHIFFVFFMSSVPSSGLVRTPGNASSGCASPSTHHPFSA
jgi:hypothetical protein